RFCRLAQPGRRLLSNQGYAGCRSELREAVRVCARLCWVSRRQSNWVLEGMLPVWDRWALSFAILPLQGELLATGFWLLAVSLGVLRAEFCNSAATGMVLAASFSLLGPCFGVLGTEFCKFAATEVWSEPTK